MGMMISELTDANLPESLPSVRRRIIVQFCCSCLPVIATKIEAPEFEKTNLANSFQKILHFAPKNQDDLKVYSPALTILRILS